MNRNSFWAPLGLMLALLLTMPMLISQIRHVFGDAIDDRTAPTQAPAAPAPAPVPRPAPAAPAETPFDWNVVLYIVAIILAIAAVAVGIWLGVKVVKRIRAGAAAKAEAQQQEAALRQKRIDRWNIGVTALAAASDALWAFEADPMSVYITRRLLADTSEPASAEFYAAYSFANDLRTETIPDDDETIEEFVAAARKAREAFGRADENALRKARQGYTSGGRQFTAEERRKVELAGKFLNHAFDAGATPAEAKTAHTKALSLLDEAGASVPERLAAKLTLSLEHAHRPALTAGSGA